MFVCSCRYWAGNWMQIHRLIPGPGPLPIVAGPPPATAPDLLNCSTRQGCVETCDGYASCPDGTYYCCADAKNCRAVHKCATGGLQGCACNAG